MSNEVSDQEIERELQTLRYVLKPKASLTPGIYVGVQHLHQVRAHSQLTPIYHPLHPVHNHLLHPHTPLTTTLHSRLPMVLMTEECSGCQPIYIPSLHLANSEIS